VPDNDKALIISEVIRVKGEVVDVPQFGHSAMSLNPETMRQAWQSINGIVGKIVFGQGDDRDEEEKEDG
jgi:hypothetical protein